MDAVHIHLMLNHIPVLGSILGLVLLILAAWLHNKTLTCTALGLLLFVSLMVIPVYLSGKHAEDRVEDLPGVSKTIINAHQDSAGQSLASIGILGLLSLIRLILIAKNKPSPKGLTVILYIAALITVALMSRTAYLGGQIRHTEIRPSGQAIPLQNEKETPEKDET